MALAHQLDRWLSDGAPGADKLREALAGQPAEPVALPRKLALDHGQHPAFDLAKRLPALLDSQDERDDSGPAAAQARSLTQLIQNTLGSANTGPARIETYYGLLLMDGDHMGAWLAGGDQHAISYRDSFHPQVRAGFDAHALRQPLLRAYAQQKRALSPNRHLAISGALNDFSQVVARQVIESEHLGRLIYAGGDDVLAMLPVADLLPAMQRLRVAYAGHDPDHADGDRQGLALKNGFALLDTPRSGPRLMRMMGEHATASCGAVVAHHQAPLAAVLRELRLAEKRAKGDGGRNAFSLTLIKRSGGTLLVTAKWGEPVALLTALRNFLAADGVSHRAVFNTLAWLNDLPRDQPEMLTALLAYQLSRQAGEAAINQHAAPTLARRLSDLAFNEQQRQPGADPRLWLHNFMSAAEFLARETRRVD